MVAGTVVAVTASAAGVSIQPFAAATPTPTPKAAASPNPRQQACDDFVSHFASDLGKSTADVNNAAQKAFGQTIDDQVKAGQITQQQGDQLKQKLASQPLCSGALAGIGERGQKGPEFDKSMLLADAAKALGMSTADLEAQLKSGKSLKDIATAKGMTEQQFRDAFVAAVKTDLDAQVKAGNLTQPQEDAIINRLKTAPLPFWDRAPGPGPGHMKPTPTPTP